jgi:Fe-S-cluster-containing dehydrogenase component
MSNEKKRHGLLIDYEYCTGCYACQVACCQEYGHEAGSSGMSVIEQVVKRRNGKPYLAFIPFPTELCILCNPRTKKGLQPACAQHCMARVIKWGEVEELAKQMRQKPRQVLWAPK